MARKLAIQNIVKVPVKFTLNDGGKLKSFSFSLTCDRLDQDEITNQVKDDDTKIIDVMRPITHGWHGQTLVVEEDGTPADFDDESFELMFKTTGVGRAIYLAYLSECAAKSKN